MTTNVVRIDEAGVVHPVGRVAQQWMGARQGTFRLLPSPPQLVFLQQEPDLKEKKGAAWATVRLAGEITRAGELCDILSLVAQSSWKGELVVADGMSYRSIFFEKGSVVGANSTVERERIGAVLFRYGALNPPQIGQILREVKAGQRFGEVAIGLGLISPEKLYHLMGKQTEEIVRGALFVERAMFYFMDRYDESRLTTRHVLDATSLVMDSVRRMDEMRYFRQRIPSEHYVPVRTQREADVPDDCRTTFDLCDGVRTIGDIGRTLERGEFETTRIIYQLVQAQLVRLRPPRPTEPEALVAELNTVLRLILEAAARARISVNLSEQLAGFGGGSGGVYEALFAGAGPSSEGTFDAARVARNCRQALGPAGQATLAQKLYEYAAFALFVVRQGLPPADEEALVAAVGERLSNLGSPV